jgi:hypothetical protein
MCCGHHGGLAQAKTQQLSQAVVSQNALCCRLCLWIAGHSCPWSCTRCLPLLPACPAPSAVTQAPKPACSNRPAAAAVYQPAWCSTSAYCSAARVSTGARNYVSCSFRLHAHGLVLVPAAARAPPAESFVLPPQPCCMYTHLPSSFRIFHDPLLTPALPHVL